ncbi:MAG: hypothetical protein RLY31_2903 [Bacteroidota bacterium]
MMRNGSVDNCGTVNLVGVSPSQFDCGDMGAEVVTLTANDGHGNQSCCQATVRAVYAQLTTQVTAAVCGESGGGISLSVAGTNGSTPIACSVDGGATWPFSGSFGNLSSGVYSAGHQRAGPVSLSFAVAGVDGAGHRSDGAAHLDQRHRAGQPGLGEPGELEPGPQARLLPRCGHPGQCPGRGQHPAGRPRRHPDHGRDGHPDHLTGVGRGTFAPRLQLGPGYYCTYGSLQSFYVSLFSMKKIILTENSCN